MHLVFGRDGEVADLVGYLTGLRFSPPFVALGIARNDGLIGGAVFNGFNGADIHLSMAGPGILSRGVMRALAHYAFVQAGCRRVSMTVRTSNVTVHRLARRCGFQIEGVKERGYPDEDAIMYGLLPEKFPWLKFEVQNGRRA